MIEFIGGVITGILVMMFVELFLWKCVIWMTELTVFIASISGTIVGMILLMAFDKLRG